MNNQSIGGDSVLPHQSPQVKTILTELSSDSDQLNRLKTLLQLRWFAILAQSLLIVLGVSYWDLKLALQPIGILILSLVISNLTVTKMNINSQNLCGAILLFDLVILTLMLHLTGGPANPFSVFYLVHVMLAAIMSDQRWTWGAVLVSSLGFAGLFWFESSGESASMANMSMHHHGSDQNNEHFSLHLQGMWFAYTLSAIIIATFVSELTKLFKSEREKRLKGEQLIALAALAAGAAHEIGNPLGTIRLITSDLEDFLTKQYPKTELLEDIALINDELSRARNVVNRMASSAGELNGESILPFKPQTFFNDLLIQFKNDQNIELTLTDHLPTYLTWPKEACTQIFVQLLRNACQASPKQGLIKLSVSSKTQSIIIRITDQGQGMSNEVLARAGEPFFTTRTHDGMGLGLFIAKSLIERLQGSFTLSSQPNIGTTVEVSLPIHIKA